MSGEVSLVEKRINASLPRFDVPDTVPEEVEQLIGKPLTADDAVRIAMLANRDARAALAELGIARGAYVQAGLIPNPQLEFGIRDPGGPQPVQIDLGLELDLTRTVLTPLRTGVAEAVLDAERLKAAGALIDLGYRTRLAFFDLQAAQKRLELRNRALEAWQASWETANELAKQGNLNGMQVANELAQVETARLQVAEAENAMLDARERLTRQLGLHGKFVKYSLAGTLDAPPPSEKDALSEAKAVQASLELAELQSRAEAASRKVGLAKTEGWVPDLNAGFHGEQDGALWELGAHLTVSLPVFDQQQGRQLSSRSEYDVMRARAEGQALLVRSAVRQTLNRLESSTRRSKHYADRLLPARRKALEETVLQYNAMQLGVFQVLSAQRAVTETELAQVDATLDARRAHAALELLLAGRSSPLELGMVPSSSSGLTTDQGGH
ncbi:MAG: TolC family protein [Archangium sp.]|nr:TolC family protein [Archangium sp.]